MGNLAISLFGSLRVTLDGTPVNAFESDKVRALLAYLSVEADRAHPRETLAGLLWPGHPEQRARPDLSQALYNLRAALRDRGAGTPPFLLVSPETIQFNVSSDHWLDVGEFTGLIDACDQHAHAWLESCTVCQQRLQKAVSLYNGDFLADFSVRDSAAFDEWCLVTRERHRLLAHRALSSLAGFHEKAGQIQPALAYARRLAKIDPLHDDTCRQLMRLLVASGKRSEALAHYESYQCMLLNELGVAPDQETSVLYEGIRVEGGRSLTHPRRQNNLTVPLSPLIGREAELAELQVRLLDPACRLLTVLGPGGSGKSRLALEAARGLLEYFVHGVYLISLSTLTSVDVLVPSLANAIGFRLQEKKPLLGQLLDYLRQKEVLFVLDGFEGLLQGVETILKILHSAPGLKILATSRARLNAEEEQLYPLGGLECPSSEHPEAVASSGAVRLFVSGARRVRAGFELTSENQTDLIDICCQVDGIPLAILLASAWVEVFSPAEILAEMRSSLDFLQADWSDLPARQRSVRATFDYSWKLLEEAEQTVFQALCVIRGRFTRQAAESVAGANPQVLRRLVDKSLVSPQAGEWYVLHTLLRQYGLEKLNELPAASLEIHRSYSTYYLGKLKEWVTGLKGARQMETLAVIDAKINDLRAAWDWAAENHTFESLWCALEGLCLYYELRARINEGQSICRATLERLVSTDTPQARRLRALLAAWESRFFRLVGEYTLASQRLGESQAWVDGLADAGLDARNVQAMIHVEAGEAIFTADLATVQRLLEWSLDLYRLLGDTWNSASVLLRLGINRHHAGDFSGSDRLLIEAIELFQKLDAPSNIAKAQRIMAQNQFRLGQTESALALMRQVITVSQVSGDRAQAMLDLHTLGLAMVWNGIYDEGSRLLHQALQIAEDFGNRYEITFIQLALGMCQLMTAQYDLSHRHLALAFEIAHSDGFKREEAASLFAFGCLDLVEKTPQEALPHFQESVVLYRQIGYPDELSWALSLDAFSRLACGETSLARQSLMEALEIAVSIRGYMATLFTLVVGGLWLGSQGECEKALELYTLVAERPILANSPWFHELFGKSVAACTASLPGDIATAAQKRGHRQDPFVAVSVLAEELLLQFPDQK